MIIIIISYSLFFFLQYYSIITIVIYLIDLIFINK